MKQFFKMTLAALCGCVLAGIATLIFLITFIGNLFSTEEAPVLKRGSILRIDMSEFALSEQPQSTNLQAFLQGNAIASIGLWDAVTAIRRAAEDPKIECIFLKPDGMSAGISQIEELRSALTEFRKSGKAVVSFCEFPTLGSYYLATASDKIYLSSNKGAGPQINGVGTQMIFLGDLLENLGVNVQLIRHGKFKSAGEMFTKGKPSEENLLQTRQMVNSIWESISSDIAYSRGIEKKDFQNMVVNLSLNNCADLADNNLADELLTREELKSKLAILANKDSYKDVTYINFYDYIKLRAKRSTNGSGQVAVLFASGDIVEGSDPYNIDGDRFASIIASLREDENVKAVVLRVSSPGGSVLASDKIKTEIDLLRKEKPVIASYGDYAASGGYWISNSCDKIYSDKTTLTGSIGVFAMIPDISRTLKEKLKVNVVTVSSSEHNGGMFAPLDAKEKESLQTQIDQIYNDFVSTVSEGRGLEKEYVDELAQGRVWTGADALGLGLVDEIGTLSDAINYAISLTGVQEGNISVYPKVETSFLDELVGSMSSELSSENDVLSGTPLRKIEYTLMKWYKASEGERFFARLPYDIEIK